MIIIILFVKFSILSYIIKISGLKSTIVFADCLGSAEWSYITDSKKASWIFGVNSIAVNNNVPLNLDFDHLFKSSRLSSEENSKIIKDLSNILVTVGAIDIESSIHYHPVSQEIVVLYKINNVEQNKVNSLTTTIASVCEKLIDDLAGKYTCGIQISDNASPDITCNNLLNICTF